MAKYFLTYEQQIDKLVNEKGLAQFLEFQMVGSEEKIDRRNGQPYVLQKYFLKL